MKDVSMGKIMSYYYPTWLVYATWIVTILNGFGFPLYGLIFSEILFVMLDPYQTDYVYWRNYWCGLLLLLSFGVALFAFFNKFQFVYLGENLTFSVRKQLFTGIIFKHLAWFDNKDRAPGILSNVLSEDVTLLNGLTTEVIALLVESFLALVIGMIISLIYSWQIALVSIAVSPTVIFGGIMMSRIQWKQRNMAGNTDRKEKGKQDPYEESNALLSDMIMNYRTVISFGDKNINKVMDKYEKLLEEPNRIGVRNAHIAGFYFGYSQMIRFIFVGFVFYIGSIFIYDKGQNPKNTYIAIYVIFVAALGSGIAIAQAPSIGKAKNAAVKIFDIIEEPSLIDTRKEGGHQKIEKGEIEFKRVDFKYPSRT